MSTSKSELLMRQFERVNSAKQLSTDWDYSQSSSLADSDETEERKLAVLIEWLNTILPDLKLPPKASVEELRECLADGTVLLQILRKVKPRSFTKELEGVLEAEIVSPSQNVQLFLDNIDERGIPKFEMEDLEKGSMKRVVDCLLSIRVRYPTGRNNFSSTNGRMTRSGSLREFSPYQSLHLGTFSSSLSSPGAERQPLYSESKFQQFLRTSPALSESSAAWMHHAGHRFHEVFQVRQGRYADLSPSKISEMMKSTSLDNAPTQSLLSVVNGILDESIDRKNGEIPHRVACLLRKVVQEIERRISTQAEHLRTQNNLFKAREEKYQSRIRVLETLASGTGEQPAVIIDQLPPIKGVKVKMEEKSKVNEEIAKLMREKEHASIELARLRQELETTKTIYDDMVKLMRQKDENKTSLKLPSSRQEQEQEQQKKTNIEISALQQEVAAGKKELNQIVESVREADQQKNEQNNAEVLALKQELASTRKELDGIVGSMKQNDQIRVGDDVVRLAKEKEEMSLQVVALKQELERVSRQGSVDKDVDVVRLVKEKDDLSGQVVALKQELERVSSQGNVDDVVRLVKEKEEMSHQLATLKHELDSTRQLGHGNNVDDDEVVRLVKEKEELSSQLATSRQELERVKGNVDSDHVDVARLVKEKEEMSLKISSLQQELETSRRQGNNDADLARLMKENEEMSLKISSLQQEHEEMVRLMKEKDQKGHDQLLKLQQETDSTKRELDDMARLVKEKDQANLRLAMSMQELELANKAQEQKYLQLEAEAKTAADGFETRLKEVSSQLSRSKAKLESDQQSWSKKQNSVLQTVDLQFHSLHELRFSSTSIKQEVLQVQQDYTEKFLSLGVKFKTLVDASENYYLVLAENRRLFNELQDLRGNIRVYCRVRPFLPGQSSTNKSIVDHIGDKGELVVGNPAKAGKDGRKLFRFNKVYGPEATQAEVYLDTQPLVQSVLDGYNVCIFAYGQTGSGKTYTMLGPNGAKEEEWGVNYRALKDLFNMSKGRSDSITYEVGVQMVEIYNEQVRDLLTNDPHKKLGILTTTPSNGVAVPDATMLPVYNTSDVMDLMQIGLNNRAVSATAMNERSSRSHSVLSIHVKGKDLQAGTTLFGNLHLVDLAGSERIDRSEVTGTALKEAQHINKSLSALGDVIFALAQKSTHVPYRNSKLTQLLQSSLGGQAKTLMFVQLNPDATSFSESLSTLKFAERVSGIELGAAKSNPGKDVKELMEQLASLKDTIANKDEEIERLQVLKGGAAGHPPPARMRTRRSASGEKGLGLTSEKDSETGGDSESRYSDNYMSDGEASVGTEPESVHDDAGGGGGRASSAEKRTAGPKGLTKARSLQRLTESRPSTTVTVSRDHLKGSTSVKKTTAGSSSSTLQKPTSSSRSRRP